MGYKLALAETEALLGDARRRCRVARSVARVHRTRQRKACVSHILGVAG